MLASYPDVSSLLPVTSCWVLVCVQTVIECLKQACTGELPPNVGGNGRNWVMDPKVGCVR